MKLAQYYINEFYNNKLQDFSFQLDNFIVYDHGSGKRYFNLKKISELAKVLVKLDLHQTLVTCLFVYQLTFILFIATFYVERTFTCCSSSIPKILRTKF